MGNDTGKNYKVTELAAILGVTPKTLYKAIDRGDILTSKDTVKNREITVINLTDSGLEKLKEKYREIKGNDTDYEDILTGKNTGKDIDILGRFENFALALNEQYNEHTKEYIDRITNAEKQVYLLEDSEKKKEEGYLKQIAELKTQIGILESENDRLRLQLEDLKNVPEIIPLETKQEKGFTLFGLKLR